MQLSSIAEYIFNTEFGWSEEYTDSQYGSLAEERQKEVILITDWLDAHVGELNILINTDFQVEYKLEYQSKNDPLVVISPVILIAPAPLIVFPEGIVAPVVSSTAPVPASSFSLSTLISDIGF